MDWKSKTIQAYDDSAAGLAEKFKGIGTRTDDIETGLKLADAGKDSRVVEIGCGDGRDALEIVNRVGWYEGIDPSKGLLRLAMDRLPETSFVEEDALSYDYPEDLDIVFAFASLLHLNEDDVIAVFQKVSVGLRTGGIFYISLKTRDSYEEEVKTDEFGDRMFYYYNPKIIRELAGDSFEQVYEDHQVIGHTDWFTIALKKL